MKHLVCAAAGAGLVFTLGFGAAAYDCGYGQKIVARCVGYSSSACESVRRAYTRNCGGGTVAGDAEVRKAELERERLRRVAAERERRKREAEAARIAAEKKERLIIEENERQRQARLDQCRKLRVFAQTDLANMLGRHARVRRALEDGLVDAKRLKAETESELFWVRNRVGLYAALSLKALEVTSDVTIGVFTNEPSNPLLKPIGVGYSVTKSAAGCLKEADYNCWWSIFAASAGSVGEYTEKTVQFADAMKGIADYIAVGQDWTEASAAAGEAIVQVENLIKNQLNRLATVDEAQRQILQLLQNIESSCAPIEAPGPEMSPRH